MGIVGVSYSERFCQYFSQMQTGGKPRDRALGRDMVEFYEGQISSAADPKAQVWADYQAWKSQQPPRYLPYSVGLRRKICNTCESISPGSWTCSSA